MSVLLLLQDTHCDVLIVRRTGLGGFAAARQGFRQMRLDLTDLTIAVFDDGVNVALVLLRFLVMEFKDCHDGDDPGGGGTNSCPDKRVISLAQVHSYRSLRS